MARPRSPNRDKACELWLKSGKKRPLKDIAAELKVSEEQIRKWKNQDKWAKVMRKVTLPIVKAGSRGIRMLSATAAPDRRETRTQSLRESLKLSFLIHWKTTRGC